MAVDPLAQQEQARPAATTPTPRLVQVEVARMVAPRPQALTGARLLVAMAGLLLTEHLAALAAPRPSTVLEARTARAVRVLTRTRTTPEAVGARRTTLVSRMDRLLAALRLSNTVRAQVAVATARALQHLSAAVGVVTLAAVVAVRVATAQPRRSAAVAKALCGFATTSLRDRSRHLFKAFWASANWPR